MGLRKFLPQAGQYCGIRVFLFGRVYTFDYRFLVLFFFRVSAAKSLRSGCGSCRNPPECRTHRFLAATPHVGQVTEDNWLGVSSFTSISFSSVALRFLDGHGAVCQERDDQCAVYLQPPVVANHALLLKIVHKFTYSRAGSTNHLRQR
jgi:hypothetical protein